MKQYNDLELRALKYIEDNIGFLDNNNFEAFYGNMTDIPNFVKSKISSMLLQSGINPLQYLESVPEAFLKYAHNFEDLHLTDFVIPDNIREIGNDAFCQSGLTGSLTLPKNLEHIGATACFGNYINSLDMSRCQFPIYLSAGMFISNTSLEYILLPKPDIVVTFGEKSFQNCSKLKQLIYPGTKDQFHEDIIFEEHWLRQSNKSADHITINCTDAEFYIFN